MNENSLFIIKMNAQREETWRYPATILSQDQNSVLIEAFFNRSDLPFHGITMRENDRFIERYFTDRWYNIFEIHDRDDDHLKAWYCNVTTPAVLEPGKLSYVDLALDLLVYPNGRYLILDEDEFEALHLSPYERQKALSALSDLVGIAKNQTICDLMSIPADLRQH